MWQIILHSRLGNKDICKLACVLCLRIYSMWWIPSPAIGTRAWEIRTYAIPLVHYTEGFIAYVDRAVGPLRSGALCATLWRAAAGRLFHKGRDVQKWLQRAIL